MFVAQHLDFTSFPNSTEPRRRADKKTPADYGFTQIRTREGCTVLREGRTWEIALRLLSWTGDHLVVCFADTARNGGTYTRRSLCDSSVNPTVSSARFNPADLFPPAPFIARAADHPPRPLARSAPGRSYPPAQKVGYAALCSRPHPTPCRLKPWSRQSPSESSVDQPHSIRRGPFS